MLPCRACLTLLHRHTCKPKPTLYLGHWGSIWFYSKCIVSVDWKETGVRLEYEYLPPNANTNGWSWGLVHTSQVNNPGNVTRSHYHTSHVAVEEKHAVNLITGFNSVVFSIKPFIHFKCCGANIPECHCQSSPPESVSWTNKNGQTAVWKCGLRLRRGVNYSHPRHCVPQLFAAMDHNQKRLNSTSPRSSVCERCTVLNKQGLRSVLRSSPQYTPLNNCFSHSNDWEFEIPQTLPTTKTWRFAYLPNDDGDDGGGDCDDGDGDGDGGDDQLEFHLLPLSCWLDII